MNDSGAVVTLRPKKKRYQDDYNVHDWEDFAVRMPTQIPSSPHFAGVMVGSRTELVEAHGDYGDRCGTTTIQSPETTYFAFPDKETMQEWVFRALKDKRSVFFFEVRKMGTAELRVDVGV